MKLDYEQSIFAMQAWLLFTKGPFTQTIFVPQLFCRAKVALSLKRFETLAISRRRNRAEIAGCLHERY